jgi:hypothetical protein
MRRRATERLPLRRRAPLRRYCRARMLAARVLSARPLRHLADARMIAESAAA